MEEVKSLQTQSGLLLFAGTSLELRLKVTIVTKEGLNAQDQYLSKTLCLKRQEKTEVITMCQSA